MSLGVLIADPSPLIRAGLRRMLEGTPLHVAAEADDGRQAIESADRVHPQLVLIEARMPTADSFQALSALGLARPAPYAVVFTAHDSPTYMAAALAMRASAYVLKSAGRGELIDTLLRAAEGEDCWTTSQRRRVRSALDFPRRRRDPDGLLTAREHDVLSCLVDGQTNKRLAESLEISSETAKEHVQNVLRKLWLADRTQAALWALRNGWS